MHNLMRAVSRRSAGLAVGVVLAGGMAGGVLFTPGTAFAATNGTTTAIASVTQSPGGSGTTLDVFVNVTPTGTATTYPTGTVKVTDGAGGGCYLTLIQDGAGSTASTGNCSIANLGAATYSLQASYGGDTNFGGSTSGTDWVTVNGGHPGHPGGPGPRSYSHVSTSLDCTTPVRSGSQGTCTLDVTNSGSGSAQDVTGQIDLPSQLKADFCGHGWSWGWNWYNSWGCSISGNTATENLGTLYPGQSRTVTVTFTAQSTRWLWGWGNQFREWVKVTGSAQSQGNWNWNWLGFGGSSSYSSAWVQIVPPRLWW
jgi:hypothetical protein